MSGTGAAYRATTVLTRYMLLSSYFCSAYVAQAAISLRLPYAMPRTDVSYGAICLRLPKHMVLRLPYAKPGTDRAYQARSWRGYGISYGGALYGLGSPRNWYRTPYGIAGTRILWIAPCNAMSGTELAPRATDLLWHVRY
eukprot:2779284-Rhodomonas_salina.3